MKAIGASHSLPVTDPACLIQFRTPKPKPGPHDILVKVSGVGINPVDAKIRKSLGNQPAEQPTVLGWDGAGKVIATGKEVSHLRIDDEVYYAGDVTRPGCNAEFQLVDARLVARKPDNCTMAEAAALPLVGIAAWELLLERTIVNPTKNDAQNLILIINGAGGVGSAMIPMAKMIGLQVVATASRPETIAWCKSLGADHVINHHKTLIPQAKALGIDQFTYIANLYDTDTYWETMAKLIAPMGSIGCIVEPKEKLHIGDPLKAKCVRICWEFMFARSKFQTPDMHRQGMILSEIAKLCEQSIMPKLVTRLFRGLSTENLIVSHAAMEAGKAYGKWVIDTLHE